MIWWNFHCVPHCIISKRLYDAHMSMTMEACLGLLSIISLFPSNTLKLSQIEENLITGKARDSALVRNKAMSGRIQQSLPDESHPIGPNPTPFLRIQAQLQLPPFLGNRSHLKKELKMIWEMKSTKNGDILHTVSCLDVIASAIFGERDAKHVHHSVQNPVDHLESRGLSVENSAQPSLISRANICRSIQIRRTRAGGKVRGPPRLCILSL